MTLEAVETAEASAPAATPAATDSQPKEVRVVSEKELEQRANDELDAKLSKVFKEARKEPSEQNRNPGGRFAAKNPATEEGDAAKVLGTLEKPAKPAETKPDTQKPEAAKSDKPVETPKDAPRHEAPKHWSDAAKERFAKLDHDTQKDILDAAKSERQALSKLGETVKSFKPIADLLEKNRDSFERRGASFEQGLDQLLKAQAALDINPVEAIKKLAQAYRVDLSQLAGVPNGRQPHQLPPDPEVSALKSEIAELQKQLGQVSGYVQNNQRQAYESRVQEISAAIDTFAKDKPDFDDVAELVESNFVQLKRANPGLSIDAALAQAYEAAVWANPTTRQKALEREIKAQEEKRLKALQDATRANALNVTSQPGTNQPGDLDSELRSIHRKRHAA